MGDRVELAWALPLAAFAGYVWAYTLLRCAGRLEVGVSGWHAAGVVFRGRALWSAARMFCFFQPLLRLESGIARRVSGWMPRAAERTAPEEVVVELVPL